MVCFCFKAPSYGNSVDIGKVAVNGIFWHVQNNFILKLWHYGIMYLRKKLFLYKLTLASLENRETIEDI